MKDTISEMKNTLEGINSRLGETKNRFNNLEGKVGENSQSECQKQTKKEYKEIKTI